MRRTLSTLGAKLILHLEWEEQNVVTAEEVMLILDCSYDRARQIIHRLVRDGWLAPMTRGKYELIPARRGQHAFADPNPLFVGSLLVTPYYFSYATAAFYHALSSQASATVYVATTGQPWKRVVAVRGNQYRLVHQPLQRFFGALDVKAYGTAVMMASPEKTILDCLERPAHAGGLPEVAAMLWRGKDRVDWELAGDYALRFRCHSLVQRLGYLVDLLDIGIGAGARERIRSGVGTGTRYLGHLGRWGKGGEYNATWRIVDNLPRDELLSEIQVR